MSDNSAKTPIKDASTVILLRPEPSAKEGFEVYLTRRRPELVFVGGMHVFPGGKLDVGDETPEVLSRCEGLTVERAAALLKDTTVPPTRAVAFWVGAVRELFEEAGILLAYRAGKFVNLLSPKAEKTFGAWRRKLNAGEIGIESMLVEEDLRLATDCLRYVSHWVTPEGPPRRFSTRFFLTTLPEGQDPTHHEGEVDESLWIAPGAALQAWSEKRLLMIPPTVMSLQMLGAFNNLEEVLDAFPPP
jgi:8-oxo-dGTP pyrophosphatase MutT (NUDIX family)